jgi:hypothetical protein
VEVFLAEVIQVISTALSVNNAVTNSKHDSFFPQPDLARDLMNSSPVGDSFSVGKPNKQLWIWGTSSVTSTGIRFVLDGEKSERERL